MNEETEDSTHTPGRAAVVSTVLLLGIYLVVSIAAQAYHGVGFLNDNADDVLSALGKDVLGSPLDKVLIIAVLTSASASTQTTILPATRQALSMAAHGAFPKYFARINPKYLSPGVSTIWMCVISIACFVTLNSVSSSILEDSVTATGLGIAFYYGLTGFACFWYFRRELRKSVHNLVMVGLLPLLGALVLSALLGYDIYLSANPDNSSVGTAWFGVGPPVAIAGLALVLGIVLMIAQRIVAPEPFFRWKRETADPAVLAAHREGPMADVIVLGYDESPSANAALAETIRLAPASARRWSSCSASTSARSAVSRKGASARRWRTSEARGRSRRCRPGGGRRRGRVAARLRQAGGRADRGGEGGRRARDRRRDGRREPDHRRDPRLGRAPARPALAVAGAGRPDERSG